MGVYEVQHSHESARMVADMRVGVGGWMVEGCTRSIDGVERQRGRNVDGGVAC